MDNQPTTQNMRQRNNQNKILFIILGIICAIIISLVLCIFFLVPNLQKARNKDLLQQAGQFNRQEDGCENVLNILSGVDESVLNDDEKISYYRDMFICYQNTGDEQNSDFYYSKLLDIMNEKNLTSGG